MGFQLHTLSTGAMFLHCMAVYVVFDDNNYSNKNSLFLNVVSVDFGFSPALCYSIYNRLTEL